MRELLIYNNRICTENNAYMCGALFECKALITSILVSQYLIF